MATFNKKTKELKYETYDLNRNLITEEVITANVSSPSVSIMSGGTLIRKKHYRMSMDIGFFLIMAIILGQQNYVMALQKP